jgi:hypothetical protein
LPERPSGASHKRFPTPFSLSFHSNATADLVSAERMIDHYETTSARIATADLVSAERITRREAFRAANRLSTGTRPVEQCGFTPALG